MKNINNKTESLEKALDEILQRQKKGVSFQEVLNKLPLQERQELTKLIKTSDLIKQRAVPSPSKELLQETLSQINSLSVTKTKKVRYIKPEGVGSPGINASESKQISSSQSNLLNINKMMNFLSKKLYLSATIVVILAITLGFFWHQQKSGLSQEAQLAGESENLSQDITDLNEMAQDDGLDTADQDLLALSEENDGSSSASLDDSSLEELENELESELDELLEDLEDLNSLGEDSSLDGLESDLSGFES